MAKRKQPRYSDQFRSDAVLMLEAARLSDPEGALTRVASRLGVPHQTISRWARGINNPPPHEIVQLEKRDLKEMVAAILYGFSDELIRRIQTGEIQDAPLNHIETGWGIAFDKNQLINGQPTDIHVTWAAIFGNAFTRNDNNPYA